VLQLSIFQLGQFRLFVLCIFFGFCGFRPFFLTLEYYCTQQNKRNKHKSFLGATQQAADKHTLVLVRHGESTWNLENKFTGWYDCPLSPKGHEEVKEAGQLIKKEGIHADIAFTSLLQRAIRTLWHVLEQSDQMWIPVKKAWELVSPS